MGWDWPAGSDVRIRKRVVLDELDEEEFISEWLDSVKFGFLNLIQDFMLIGRMTRQSGEEADSIKMMYRFLEGHTQDLVNSVTFQGAVIAKRVKLRTLNPERIWEVRNDLLKQMQNERMGINTQ